MSKFINPNSHFDSVRLIFLMIFGTILWLVYFYSMIKLYKVNDKRIFHIETIAIFSWLIKVLLIMAEEFIFNDEIYEFVTITLQTCILGVFLYKFVKTSIENTTMCLNNINTEIWILRVFYLLIFIILIVNLILGIKNDNYFNCSQVTYSYNWYITFGINTWMWYLNLFFGYLLYRKRKHNADDEEFNVSKRDYKRVKLQMIVFILGYAIVSTLTLCWFIAFPYVFNVSNLTCRSGQKYWIPNGEPSGAFVFVKTFLLIAPTIVIWSSFFYLRLPNKFNDQSIRINKEISGTITSSMIDNTRTLDPLILDKNNYSHNNPNNISYLTENNRRKSVFTNNNIITKSFTNE